VYNQFPLTRDCIASIRLRTNKPYELIVVDNGSTDGTAEYLRNLKDVRVIRNEENRGFPAAANQGIAAATGEFILLLNNDTVVTTGWLERLLNAFDRDPQLGLVGPSANFVASAQRIPAGYGELEDLDGFAWDLAKAESGRVEETDRLVGFCLMARKALVDQIGPLDERFGIGNYEDDDWCLRARAAGWKCGIVRDAFVHHRGHATFDAANIDLASLLDRNAALFNEKWPNAPRAGRRSPLAGGPSPSLGFSFGATSRGLRLVPRVLLSATIIVRNNERTIRACIESLRRWVDEIIVVDTGSTDRTPEICKELGAKVYYHTWPDSFADARNLALDYAAGDWIFWMDSDDVLPEECGRKLRALVLGGHDPAVLGYYVRVHCPHQGEDGETDWSVVDHVKLFRNRPDLRWEFRLHENILPAIRRAEGKVGETDIYVVHAGSDQTPEGKRKKLARDFRLLELELKDHPEHPFALFNLGMTHNDCHQYQEAIHVFERAQKVTDPSSSHLPRLYTLWASSLQGAGRSEEAQAVCAEGRRLRPDDLDLAFREAGLLAENGRHREAVAAYRRLLTMPPERGLTCTDPAVVALNARHNLAAALKDVGDLAGAAAEWESLVRDAPDHRRGWFGLLELLRDHADAAATAAAHRDYLERWPDDAGVLHNYGVALSMLGDAQAAKAALEESLRLRPGYAPTIDLHRRISRGAPPNAAGTP
jgi:GT2 family glycosyltransferase/Flp pilus assembly protein TadD